MDKALKSMIDNMPEKTGKSLDEWKRILNSKSYTKHSESVNFLKSEHGVTHGFANTIAASWTIRPFYFASPMLDQDP